VSIALWSRVAKRARFIAFIRLVECYG